MKDIVIEVRGGVVTEIYADDLDLRVMVVDWDECDPHGECRDRAVNWHFVPTSRLPAETKRYYERAMQETVEADASFTALGTKHLGVNALCK